MTRRDGQVIRRGEGKWLIRWHMGTDQTGRKDYKSKTIRGTKRDAERELRRVLRSRDLGTYVDPHSPRLGDFMDRWFEIVRGRVAPRTLEDYRRVFDKHVRPRLGRQRIDQLRALEVQLWVGDLAQEVSPRTARLAHVVLNSALKQAVRLGVISMNPAALVDVPRQPRREMTALSREEVRRFRRAAAGGRFAVLFDFLLATGCRPGEALALRWSDLDLEIGQATICRALTQEGGRPVFREPKTAKSRRLIPLPQGLVASLRAHRREQAEHALKLGEVYARDLDLVFANAAGRPLDRRNIARRHFKRALLAAGLDSGVRLYDLRHTHATLLMAEGIHPKVAAERLGHSTTRQTLDTYSHVQAGMQDEATAKIGAALYGHAGDRSQKR